MADAASASSPSPLDLPSDHPQPNGDAAAPVESPPTEPAPGNAEAGPSKPKPVGPSRRYPRLPAFVDGGLPVSESFTIPYTMVKDEELPEIADADGPRLKAWTARDAAYSQVLRKDHLWARNEVSRRARDIMAAGDWMGALPTTEQRQQLRIRWPIDRTRELQSGKARRRAGALPKLSKAALANMADDEEMLIPIRIDVEHDQLKLRDVFTWNLHDKQLTPDVFATILLEDLQLPDHPFRREIVSQINDHLEEARKSSHNVFSQRADDDETALFWSKWREGSADASRVQIDAHMPAVHEELRVLIRIDITLASVNLVDQFEWDISDPFNVPEAFAAAYAVDLGLHGDFVTAISHSIREQADAYRRALGLVEHTPGAPITHEDLVKSFMPALTYSVRANTNVHNYTPKLDLLTADELERFEKERERDARRKRRQTKGRAKTALPDREPMKTHRTLMPAAGSQQAAAFLGPNGEPISGAFPTAQPFQIVRRPIVRQRPEPPEPEPTELDDANAKKRKLGRPPRVGGLVAADAGGSPFSRATTPEAEGVQGTASPAKKARPEDIARQHENVVNGVWHCTNCGCPDGVAQGRRKGPLGLGTMCRECGIYYRKHLKVLIVDYTTDPAEHERRAQLGGNERYMKRSANSLAGSVSFIPKPSSSAKQRSNLSHAAFVPPQEGDDLVSDGGSSPSLHDDDDDDDDFNSADEDVPRKRLKPLGRPRGGRAKMTSATHISQPIMQRPPSGKVSPSFQYSTAPPPQSATSLQVSPPGSASFVPATPTQPPAPPAPQWLSAASDDLRARHPEHRFDIVPRRNAATAGWDWRIRCEDCPGKIYASGPDETLSNFEIHLANRKHLAAVDARIQGAA